MLVLERKRSQSFHIDDDIEVVYLGPGRNSNQIRIGIHAPKNRVILREELYEQKKVQEDLKK